jgi:hypothetical protein
LMYNGGPGRVPGFVVLIARSTKHPEILDQSCTKVHHIPPRSSA